METQTQNSNLQTYLDTLFYMVRDTFANPELTLTFPELNFQILQKEISFYVNTSIASAKIRKLTINEPEGDYQARPTFHTGLIAPIGMLKSTILKEISKIVHKEVITETTRAGLVGSIDYHNKGLIYGSAWDSRNSLLLLDEFTFGKKNKEGWEVFLQLLESGHYSKRIAVTTEKFNKKERDLYIKFDKGKIDLQTRFACVFGTMKKLEFRRGEDFRAFMSRVNPCPYNVSIDALNRIANGEQIFKYEPLQPQEEITISPEIYNKILNCVNKIYQEQTIIPEFIRKEIFLRSINDICRVYAVYQTVDYKRWKQIAILKLWAQSRIGFYYRNQKKRLLS